MEVYMPEYQLEIKQVVDYPRCRIYRQFIQSLMNDRSIRVSGGSGLFYITVLSSYANFRTTYRRIDGISYTWFPFLLWDAGKSSNTKSGAGKAENPVPAVEHHVCISEGLPSISKSHIQIILGKMAKILTAQGVSCFGHISRIDLLTLSILFQ